MKKHTREQLKDLQSMSFEEKLSLTKDRIFEWYYHWKGKVYVFISGKDSTVLLDIARQMFPDVLAVYIDTGLEYPEVRELALSHDNVKVLYPKKGFWQVVKEEGYPIISKEVSECIANARKHLIGGGTTHTTQNLWELGIMPQRVQKILGILKMKGCPDKSAFNLEKWKPLLDMPFKISNKCCTIMKKTPAHKFTKESGLKAITGQMVSESRLRTQQWLKNGCNGFDMKEPVSNPMSFWKEDDVLRYIKEYNVKIPSVYGEIVEIGSQDGLEQLFFENCSTKSRLCTTGCQRTGCIYCGFGVHLEKGKTRFQMLKETHLKLYNYCMGGGEFDKNDMWVPTPSGLGLKFVFDKINEVYGKDFIRYE